MTQCKEFRYLSRTGGLRSLEDDHRSGCFQQARQRKKLKYACHKVHRDCHWTFRMIANEFSMNCVRMWTMDNHNKGLGVS